METASDEKQMTDDANHFQSKYHFPAHSIFALDEEPISVCVAEDMLLVATVGHYVEVRKLEDRGFLSHTFNSVDLVKQIIYCKTGQYVATLEVKTSRQSLMTHVRQYLNWQVDTKGMPMRARIAGRVTPSSQCSVGQLEMVELPLQKQACYIGCCQSTGNLAVSCGCSISIYHFCVKVHDISKLLFHDLEHLMDVCVTFPIKEVALCEDYLACISANELHVIRIDFQGDEKGSLSTEMEDEEFMKNHRQSFSSRSSKQQIMMESDTATNIEDDSDVIVWNPGLVAKQNWELTSHERNEATMLKEKLRLESWPLTIRLASLQQQNVSLDGSNVPVEILGPIEFFPGHSVKIENAPVVNTGCDLYGRPQFISVSLVYRSFPLPLLAAKSLHSFCLHSLLLLPLYVADDTMEKSLSEELFQVTLSSNVENPLHSARHRYLKQVDVFFSTPCEGFTYSLIGEVQLTAVYNYRSPVCHVALDASILHAVTASSVESYSRGNWKRIFQHFCPEFQTDDLILFSPKEQIRLLGLHPFVNIRQATFGEGHLILLTTGDDQASGGCSWTAYVLQCPPADYLYHDLMEEENANVVSEDFFLKHEALAILATEVLLNRPPPSSRLSLLFEETCCHIANIYLWTNNLSGNNVMAAVKFYDMSGSSLDTVMKNVLSLISKDNEGDFLGYKSNVLQCLTMLFIDGRFPRLKPLPKEVAHTVIEIFAKDDTMPFTALFLKGHLPGYDPKFALEFMNSKMSSKKCCVEDVLVTCILSLHADSVAQMPVHLAALTNDDLIRITVKYPNIWIRPGENEISFMAFMQVVQQFKPSVFVKIVRQLIVLQQISLKVIHHLCQSDWEDLGLAPRTDAILLQFLEAFLTDKSLTQWHCFEATSTLVTLYLKCLASLEPKGTLPTQNRPWILFGPRSSWLCELPPFRGQSMHNLCKFLDYDGEKLVRNCPDVECPCVSCNDCLLRLQSFLCSDFSTIEVKYRVTCAIMAAPTLKGALSLQILCSPNYSHAVTLLVDHCPSVLLEYCKDVFQQDMPQWQSLLDSLCASLQNISEKGEKMAAINATISGTVSHLAEFVPPAQLVMMLPKTQNSNFLPQVRRSIAKLQAKHLHEIIVSKGHELKALV